MKEIPKRLFVDLAQTISASAAFADAIRNNEMRKASEIKAALDELSQTVQTYLNGLKREKGFRGHGQSSVQAIIAQTSKDFRQIIRQTDAIKNGIDLKQMNLGQVRSTVRTQTVPVVKSLLESLASFSPLDTDPKELKTTDLHSDVNQVFDHIDSTETSEDSHGISDEARKQVQKYSRFKSKLPTSLRGKLFTLVNMPIVPFASFSLMTPSFLRRTGIQFSIIDEMFPVLENQLVLAFDRIAATSYKGRKTGEDAVKIKGLRARKRSQKHHSMQEQMVFDVIDDINASSDKEYVLVSTHFVYSSSSNNVFFAWIMPRNNYKVFERAKGNANIRWGFPWSQDAEQVL